MSKVLGVQAFFTPQYVGWCLKLIIIMRNIYLYSPIYEKYSMLLRWQGFCLHKDVIYSYTQELGLLYRILETKFRMTQQKNIFSATPCYLFARNVSFPFISGRLNDHWIDNQSKHSWTNHNKKQLLKWMLKPLLWYNFHYRWHNMHLIVAMVKLHLTM